MSFSRRGLMADLIIHVSQLSSQTRPASYACSPDFALSHLCIKSAFAVAPAFS